jgi:sporulation protein YlmC with PRC-barrel domain
MKPPSSPNSPVLQDVGYVNVLDKGARGDGTTNDTEAFEAAIAEAGAGGTVFVPPTSASYRVNDLSLLSQQTLRGVGRLSKLQAIGGTYVVKMDGLYTARISDILIDGNSKASKGLRIRGLNSAGGSTSQSHLLDHVAVEYCSTGITIDGAGVGDQVDKNTYLSVWIAACGIGVESSTANSQSQCFIGGAISDSDTVAVKTFGQMSFIGWMAQQTAGGAGVTCFQFAGGNVDSIVLIDCYAETFDIVFDSTASNWWPLNGVQVQASVLIANTHIAKVDRGGSTAPLIVRGSRLVGGTIDLRGDATAFVDEFNDPSSTTTVTRTGAATRWHRRTSLGAEGQSLASAASITIPAGADTVFITGTTNIATITTATAHHGQEVSLMFSTSLTVQNSGNLKLAGGANFSATADDMITFVYNSNDGAWREKARSVNA